MKNIKYKIWPFLLPDYKAAENYLSEMAKEGFLFQKIIFGGLFAKFQKISPKNVRFYVDLFPKEKAVSYIELCADSGWELLCERGMLKVFKARDGQNPEPIQTDPEVECANVLKVLKGELISFLVLFGLLFLSLVMEIRDFGYETFLGNLSIATLITTPFLLIIISIYLLFSIKRMRVIRRAAENGESPATPEVRSARSRGGIFLLLLYLIIFIGLIVILVDTKGNIPILLMAFTPVIIGWAGGLLIRRMKNGEKWDREMVAISVVIMIGACLFSTAMGRVLSGATEKRIYPEEEREKALSRPVVTLAEIYPDEKKTPDSAYFYGEYASVFLKQGYRYGESIWKKSHFEEGMSVDSEVYVWNEKFIADMQIPELLRELEHYGGSDIHGVSTVEFSADEGYYSEERNTLILRKGNTIAIVSGSADFFAEGIPQAISTKVFRE